MPTALTIGELARALEKNGIAHHVCVNPAGPGVFIAMPGCARILAFGANLNGRSVFWWDARILDAEEGADPQQGATGGERLWFAPEYRYHWKGDPDWTDFANYSPSPLADPGNYVFAAQLDGGVFRGEVVVLDHPTGRAVRASITKTVRFIAVGQETGSGFGIEIATELTVEPNEDGSAMDIWSIIQVPPGTRLEVPLTEASEPLGYSPTGNWFVRDAAVFWDFTGTEQAKMGLAASQVTGLAIAHFGDDDAPCRTMVIRFPWSSSHIYCDHPADIPRTDQLFQAWDGFGFGEMEFHSPAAFARANENRIDSQYRIECHV